MVRVCGIYFKSDVIVCGSDASRCDNDIVQVAHTTHLEEREGERERGRENEVRVDMIK